MYSVHTNFTLLFFFLFAMHDGIIHENFEINQKFVEMAVRNFSREKKTMDPY